MKNKTLRIRFAVMIVVLVVAAIGYFTKFGLGTICGIGFSDITLLCPLGALLTMIAERAAVPMAVVSVIAVLVVCIVLGKVFCSWVCPGHFMQSFKVKRDKKKAIDASIEKELGGSSCAACAHPCGQSRGIHLDSRHGILAAALVSTGIFGFPVFCLVCPVGLTFATVLLVMRLFAFGETTWTIVAFIAIIAIEMLVLPRWCKHFCPLGALMSLFSGLNKTFQPSVDTTKCLHAQNVECDKCVEACPEFINLHDIAAGESTLNDCSKCRACADVCPTSAISFPFTAKKLEAGKE